MTVLDPGRGGLGDGVYGLQAWHGVDVIQGSHACGKGGCGRPAFVAVFGKLSSNPGKMIRVNTCREHVEGVFHDRDVLDPWICALLGTHGDGDDYCPHCATRRSGPKGQGHLRRCPIGLTSREFAAHAKLPWEAHDQHDCETCSSYMNRRPGPTG